MLSTERIKGRPNWGLVIVAALLCALGLVNLYSAALHPGEEGVPQLFWNQTLWLGIGILSLVPVAFVDYRFWGRIAIPLYILYILMMVAVLVAGKEVAGNKSWIVLGPLNLQPSEIGKIILPLMVARSFARHPSGGGYYLRELIGPSLLILIPTLLIILQGDFGGTVFYVLIYLSLLFFAGIRRAVVTVLLIAALTGGAVMYRFVLTPPQRARIVSFVNPGSDPRGQGYQINQSKIAIGSGWIAGQGYLHGLRHKLYYVPARHTDFVFSVWGEEWGFLGSVLVVALYLSLIFLGVETASGAKDRFGVFFAMGLTASIFWQAAINLFGVTGMIPLTGVTLPFFSYGGSSLIVMLTIVGLLLSIRARRFMF